MKRIPIIGRDGIKKDSALVDDEDYERVSRFRWFLSRGGNGINKYAVTYFGNESLRMHHLILRHSKKLLTDHINGYGLDNRKKNLRAVTCQQNNWNRGLRSDNKSGIPGCYWESQKKRWRVLIKRGGRKFHGGFFVSKTEAAKSSRKLRKDLFGDFARV